MQSPFTPMNLDLISSLLTIPKVTSYYVHTNQVAKKIWPKLAASEVVAQQPDINLQSALCNLHQ